MASVRPLDGTRELSVEEVDSPGPLAAEWTRLAERSGNVFGHWEWLSLWWEHFGRGRTLRIVACRDADGELVAILCRFAGGDMPFQRAFARRAFDLGWLRLRFLEVDGRPAATSYVLRFSDVDADYQNGRDPAFERDSVGFVLLNHAVRSAVESGRREYRFLCGSEEYKYRFAALQLGWRLRRRPAVWRTYLGARRLLGRR